MNNIIEVKDLKKVYHMGKEKIYAVNGVNFTIREGEFCCLLGTSGSGKSTLLNLMAGIEKASKGSIIIKGEDVVKLNETKLAKFRQNYLGFVFQAYNLIGSMNALENVAFPLIFKRVPAGKRKKMAIRMLKRVGLGERLYHKPKEMSGGQQQRVGIARAFVANPQIVFADEPTGNLDTKTTMEVMDLIHDLARRNKQTIVMVTHDPRLAEYGDKIIRVSDGKIVDVEVRKTDEEILNEQMEASRRAEIEKMEKIEKAKEAKRRKEEAKALKAAGHKKEAKTENTEDKKENEQDEQKTDETV